MAVDRQERWPSKEAMPATPRAGGLGDSSAAGGTCQVLNRADKAYREAVTTTAASLLDAWVQVVKNAQEAIDKYSRERVG